MKTRIVFVMSLLLCLNPFRSLCQEAATLTEKSGTFGILSRTDYITSGLTFTKAEITANLEKIKEVVAVVRQKPVLIDIKGFNGRARIYTMSMVEKERYGIPSRISFEFSSFFLSKKWSLYINNLIPVWTDGFSSKHGYFTVPLRKKSPDRGIDIYDEECFVLYDPSRPPYWIPAPERNNRAYFGGGVTRVSSRPGLSGQDSIFPYIMKVNPEYLDRSRQRSDIQFINFRAVQNKKYLKSLLDECRQYWAKGSGSGCDLLRFELSFGMTDIRNLTPLVQK